MCHVGEWKFSAVFLYSYQKRQLPSCDLETHDSPRARRQKSMSRVETLITTRAWVRPLAGRALAAIGGRLVKHQAFGKTYKFPRWHIYMT